MFLVWGLRFADAWRVHAGVIMSNRISRSAFGLYFVYDD